ncbi:hypothetical protein N0V82_001302 [Gnomoniopsis sp. IMI 355080]|nr:hypothetical protein N0V82_001302 [Gnomoniopsis sp. IMI 355080]
MHAITEMTRQIRAGIIRNGLVLANGGVVSYQHAICLSSKSKGDGTSYPDSRAGSDATVDELAPVVDTFAEGEAIIETYTVEFSREGAPETAFVIGRLKGSGHRFIANHGDKRTLQHLSSALEEQIGAEGFVRTGRTKSGEPENNLFYLGPRPGL